MSGASVLQVGGVTPLTSIDFPGRLAAVVFVQGCPWRCRYCHNPHLQPRQAPDHAPAPTWPQVAAWLARRVGLLDGVVFSGGEPTLDPGLRAAIDDVRSSGFAAGLHTAGIYPGRLHGVLAALDWVGFDVKAPLARDDLHERIVGVRGGASAVRQSLRAVLESGVALECRTTAHPDLLQPADLVQMGEQLAAMGVQHYALQVARPVPGPRAALAAVGAAYPGAEALARLAALFPRFTLRRD